MSDLEAEYDAYVAQRIIPMQENARTILQDWKEASSWADGEVVQNQPIRRYSDRIKSVYSLKDKLHKRTGELGALAFEDQFAQTPDIYGARIIAYSISDMRTIDERIRRSNEFVMHSGEIPKSYFSETEMTDMGLSPLDFNVKGRKRSGYSSLHYILRPSATPDAWMELQVRTMLVDAWAELEHDVIYKPEILNDVSLTRHFSLISDHLKAIDEHFDLLVAQVRTLQNTREAPRPEDHLTSLNLPSLCRQLGLTLPSGETTKILRILNDYDFLLVRDVSIRLNARNLTAMKNLRRRLGGTLTALEAISTAVLLSTDSTPNEAEETLKRQLRA